MCAHSSHKFLLLFVTPPSTCLCSRRTEAQELSILQQPHLNPHITSTTCYINMSLIGLRRAFLFLFHQNFKSYFPHIFSASVYSGSLQQTQSRHDKDSTDNTRHDPTQTATESLSTVLISSICN